MSFEDDLVHSMKKFKEFFEPRKDRPEEQRPTGRVKIPCPKCHGTGQVELELEKETQRGS